MIILLSALDIALLICLAIGIVGGATLFFLTGLFHVKKDYVMIIEKYSEYHKTCGKGWYFFLPIKYRKVGYYNTSIQERVCTIGESKKLVLTYQIIDPKLYHYSGSKVETYLEIIRKRHDEMNEEILIEELAKIGLKYISIR